MSFCIKGVIGIIVAEIGNVVIPKTGDAFIDNDDFD